MEERHQFIVLSAAGITIGRDQDCSIVRSACFEGIGDGESCDAGGIDVGESCGGIGTGITDQFAVVFEEVIPAEEALIIVLKVLKKAEASPSRSARGGAASPLSVAALADLALGILELVRGEFDVLRVVLQGLVGSREIT